MIRERVNIFGGDVICESIAFVACLFIGAVSFLVLLCLLSFDIVLSLDCLLSHLIHGVLLISNAQGCP